MFETTIRPEEYASAAIKAAGRDANGRRNWEKAVQIVRDQYLVPRQEAAVLRMIEWARRGEEKT